MKKILATILLCTLCLTACSPANSQIPTEEFLQVVNPWMEYSTLAEAETATGLTSPLPETLADRYQLDSILVMNGQLLELRYRQKNSESGITVRMCAGEGQDISGVYDTFETVTESTRGTASITVMQNETSALCLISADGYSFSLYTAADDQIPQEFISFICPVE